jgi:DNA-binding beta-propeller fold protein YncE
MYFRRIFVSAVVGATLAGCSAPGGTSTATSALTKKVPQSSNPYTLFETLQTRPLALSPDRSLLFAANTPDNRLEVFRVNHGKLTPLTSVVVGLEPIAVAVRSANEVWVVNHLSDDVSIVSLGDGGEIAAVTRTLLVGDEPRDIVFGGTDHSRAFITTAHRGQNTGDDPQLYTPGVGRADVWVFDANNLGSAAGGTRLTKITLFADTPRALAVTPDGKTVYAAAFMSGNQTTVVSKGAVETVYGGNMPGPAVLNFPGIPVPFPQPQTGLVVKWKLGSDGQYHWLDFYGTNFDQFVTIRLPDKDVFAIDATANPPVATSGVYAHVGTTLFNMAVNPKSGKVYVTNTDAHNDVRFEGFSAQDHFSSVRGREVDNRITVIDPVSGSVTPQNLNPHINYNVDFTPGEREKSVAFPQDIAITRDGSTAYVVAQGSSKLAIYATGDIESGNIVPSTANQVVLTGGGPAGVVLDEKDGVAFVLTRFDNGISTVSLSGKSETAHATLFNPEPASVTKGRQYLYAANITSAHGDQACASCHIGGDFDGLAWDLGNPGFFPLPITQLGTVFAIPTAAIEALIPQTAYLFSYYQPVKGPMTTQSLRGMDNHGGMHWRGDRNGAVQQNGQPFLDASGNPVVSAQPNGGIYDEMNAFKSFNVAFPGLVGDTQMLSDADMTDFANFALQITYPPNPIRNLDNSLTAEQSAGAAFFNNTFVNPATGQTQEAPVDRFHSCVGCHTLDPTANAGATAHPGFFGTDGKLSFENETQTFKVPHLRNMYQKIGMFGSSPDTNMLQTVVPQLNPFIGDQVRGVGYQHDGVVGTLDHFFTAQVFLQAFVNVILPNGSNAGPNPFGIPFFDPNNPFGGTLVPAGFAIRHNIVSYLFAFDSNEAPVVGQQVTLGHDDVATAGPRIDLLEARATAGECDLVVKATVGPFQVGWVYSNGMFVPSSTLLPPVTDAELRALGSAGLPLTFTAVPVGSGWRIGIDRDGDGYADGDELLAGSNPADPNSIPRR